MKTVIKYLLLLIFCVTGSAMCFAQENIKSYEYWYDSNIGSRTIVAVSPVEELHLSLSLPAGSLSNGFHVFNIRFRDDSTRYSSAVSQHFYKAPLLSGDTNKIIAYEYWIDNNIAGRILQNITPQNNPQVMAGINLSSISSGFHVFNIRFKDELKMWSSVQGQYFYKAPVISDTINKIKSYEYWIDNNIAGRITQNVTSQNTLQLLTGLDMSALPNGFHVFNIRLRDQKRMWSSAQSYHFFKSAVIAASVNTITAYEYWFDNNYAAKVYQGTTHQNTLQLITGIDASLLPSGFHVFNIRFKDERGLWSSPIASHFYTGGDLAGIPNSVDGYRYWFDGNLTTLTTVNLPVTTNPLNLVADINCLSLSTGTHTIDMQFRDLSNNWSSAIHSTFYRTCIGGTATITPGGNVSFCAGGSITLTANSGTAYLWATGQTTQSITVTTSIVDSVIVTNSSGCVDWSDPVYVTMNALPTVTFSPFNPNTICINQSPLLLTGGSPSGIGGVYSGLGVSSGYFNPSTAGIGLHNILYTFTDNNNCSNSASASITVDLCTDMNENSSIPDISIYPNPVSDMAYINNPNNDSFTLQLFDVTGKLILEKQSSESSVRLELIDLTEGVYIMKLTTDNKTILQKLIKL